MKDEEDIFNMEIHETKVINTQHLDVAILSVPGGWIYTIKAWNKGKDDITSVFVPLRKDAIDL